MSPFERGVEDAIQAQDQMIAAGGSESDVVHFNVEVPHGADSADLDDYLAGVQSVLGNLRLFVTEPEMPQRCPQRYDCPRCGCTLDANHPGPCERHCGQPDEALFQEWYRRLKAATKHIADVEEQRTR